MGKSPIFSQLLTFVLLFSLTIGSVVVGKVCTNVFPDDYATHGFRYLFQTSQNETWKREVISQMKRAPLFSRRMMRRGLLMSRVELEKQLKFFNNPNETFLKEVPLMDVKLDPNSMYGAAQRTNLEYLLILEVDDLVWSVRKIAGCDRPPGHPFGGWEGPDCELRGHFLGHYLSASAKMWASTKSETLRQRMFKVVTILSECQSEIGTGYVSAFPTEFFDRFETLRPVWAPYYTIHKIMAGLLDQHIYAGSGEALGILERMADYHYLRVMNTIQKYSIQRHWDSLNEETGGMNDVLYGLYSITGDEKHLLLAHLFDKPCFLGELAMEADDISPLHANTHIPIVTGVQRRYELTGDPMYRDMATFFVDMINSSHTYATGGTSENEIWTDPKRLATMLTTENQETCTTYNMLKVARNLFRWTKDRKYADYYERLLINGILPTQRGREPGVMIYMLPLKPGSSKAISSKGWGTPFNTTWCCYGTAIESFSKLGDSIYFEERGEVPGLYIIQYIPNRFQWRTGALKLAMKLKAAVSWFDRLRMTITLKPTLDQGDKEALNSTLHLRIPVWTDTKTVKAQLNGQNLQIPAPGTYLSIAKRWSRGDKIHIEFPISLRLEAINDDRPEYASVQAILYGPFLLAGLSKGESDIKAEPNAALTDWITPVLAESHGHLITLSSSGNTLLSLVASPGSVGLRNVPKPGTNEAVDATLRLITNDPNVSFSTPSEAIGMSVMLEPYGHPGMLLAHQDVNRPLQVVPSSSNASSSVFNLVAGLDGAAGTVSLQSPNQPDCYILSGPLNSVNLGCKGSSGDFNLAASFKMDKGISEYHPISFIAKGAMRNYLLLPLLSLRDEMYTVYFNI